MTLKRSLFTAALATVLTCGTIYGQPTLSNNKNLSDRTQIGDTRYVIEMNENDPSPVMLLLRERGSSKVIGTITFNDRGNAITFQPGASGVAGLRAGGFRNDPPSFNGLSRRVGGAVAVNDRISNGRGRTRVSRDREILDDLDDSIPIPGDALNNGGATGGTIPSNGGSPGTLPVPEPSAVVLSAAGLIIIGLLKLRQAKP